LNRKISLKKFVLWWLGAFILFLLIVFNTIMYNMVKKSFYERVKEDLCLVTKKVKNTLILRDDKIITIPPKIDYPINPVMIKVFNKKHHLVAKSIEFMNIKLYEFLQKESKFFIMNNERYGHIAIYLSKIETPIEGIILIATPIARIDAKLEDVLIKMLILSPILLLLLLLGANWMVDTILNPVRKVTLTANKISVGDLENSIPLPTKYDEIYELVKSFNKMVERLKDGVLTIERFNSDISHELKTPLTVLKGELEIALRKDRNIDYYKHTLNVSLNEVNYLIDLVEEMLFFAKMEIERDKIEEIFVDELLLQVMSKLSKQAKQQNVFLHLKRLDSINLYTNSVLLKAVFINIINNAIKYTPQNKNIYISLIKKDKKVLFIVKDEGIGISQDEINKITERFYRSEKSRNRAVKGFGLGLSIVERALRILNGNIAFNSKEGLGTEVIIELESIKI